MHLFFDTVWKLHIGEIPEKPEPKPHYLGNAYGERRYKCLVQEYNEAIAAIKQNALTVGNPELVKTMPIPAYRHLPQDTSMAWPQEGEFYKWPGGCEKKKQSYVTDGGAAQYKTVAILTLPEEKKNTMENMTEKDLAIKMANRALEVPYADPDSDICTISRQFLRLIELTASGSVAAPKEEEESLHDQLNTEQHLVRVYKKQLECVRQQLKEREEALKELLPIAENAAYFAGFLPQFTESELDQYENKGKAIIERARNLISK